MQEKTFTVKAEIGVHARPAALLVQEVRKYPSVKISLVKDGKEVDPKSILSLLSLSITKGSVLTLKVEGQEEEKILDELIVFIEKNL